ncbi:TraB/GumN family protein [Aliidiomarina sp. Khilg15.8]
MRTLFRTCSALLLAGLLSIGSAQASLLWKVSGNDLESPSYLFGTIHIICDDSFLMDERIEDAFAASESLMMEIDFAAPGTMQRLQQLMINPEGPYLDQYLDEEQLATVDAYFRDNIGAGLGQIGVLKPMALNSMVMVAGLPCAETESYEVHFTEQADEHDKPIVALESVEYQMGLFDDIPTSEQVEWLWEIISERDAAEEQMTEMVDAYAAEDLDRLLDIIREDPQFAGHVELFLDKRNQNWVAPIREQMHSGSTFVAVGAGHLPGEQGLVSLLRAAGYEVEALR